MIFTHLMFLGTCCSAVEESNADAVILTERTDEPAVNCYDLYGEATDMSRIVSLFTTLPRRRFGGMASWSSWSPDNGAASLARCVITVERGGRARMAVKREIDERWTMIDFDFAPWFAASTAGAIRAWLDGDFSSPIRQVEDPRLLGAVRDMVLPPVHEDGRI